jgi:hypothetical protein
MGWFDNFTQTAFIILVVVVLLYYIYENWDAKSDVDNYEDFSKELQSDMDRYGIEDKDQERIEKIVEKIVEKKKKEKTIKSTISSCRNGLLRGSLVGFLSGGISGAASSGLTHAAIGTFMHNFVE